MKWDRFTGALKLVSAALFLMPVCAAAQASYPNKPIWVISPLGSGGAVEIVGRIVTRV